MKQISDDPKNEANYIELSNFYKDTNFPDLSMATVNKGLEILPQNHNLYIERARTYHVLKKYDMACIDMNNATKLSNNDILITKRYVNYCLDLAKTETQKQTILPFLELLANDQNGSEYAPKLVLYYNNLNDPKAIKLSESFISKYGNSEDLVAEYFNSLLIDKQCDNALKILENDYSFYLKKDKNKKEIFILKGNIFLCKNDIKNAINEYKKAIKTDYSMGISKDIDKMSNDLENQKLETKILLLEMK